MTDVAFLLAALTTCGARKAKNSKQCRECWRAMTTHCPQGHPYNEENTYLYRGARHCKECVRERNRQRRARKKLEIEVTPDGGSRVVGAVGAEAVAV